MEVDDFSLAYDILEAEGVNADFLYNQHTINNFKSEFMTPILSDRAPYSNFAKREGKNSLVDRAVKQLEKYREKVRLHQRA